MDLKSFHDLEIYFADHFDTAIFPILAEHYLLQGDFRRAHKVCEIGFDHHPGLVTGLFVEARVYLAEGELKLSEKMLKQIINLDPDHYNAHVLLAEVQTVLGRADTTLDKLHGRILQMDKTNEKARAWVAKSVKKEKLSPVRRKRKRSKRQVRKPPERFEGGKAIRGALLSEMKVDLDAAANSWDREKTGYEENLANLSISPDMATFTLMAILKSQKLYEQALVVLAVMSEKEGADLTRIEKEREELTELLKMEGEHR